MARASPSPDRSRPARARRRARRWSEALLAEQELPADFILLLSYLFSEVLDGRNAHLTDGVQRALGREPRDVSEFARDAAATGAWNRAAVRL